MTEQQHEHEWQQRNVPNGETWNRGIVAIRICRTCGTVQERRDGTGWMEWTNG